MAKEREREIGREIRGKRTEGELDSLSTIDAIRELVKVDVRNSDSEEGLLLFLKSWWSRHYNKPMKDPILESYTLYELLYEYYDKIERTALSEELLELETDKIEQDKEQEAIDWAEEEERKERKAIEAAAAEDAAYAVEEEKWMLEKLKAEHGDDFGKDIDADFEG